MKCIHKNSELNEYLGVLAEEEITDALIECFEDFRREDARIEKADERHIDYSDYTYAEENGLVRIGHKDILDVIIYKELMDKLSSACSLLTKIQKRRWMMYYYENIPLLKIASIEKTDYKAVWKSIYGGTIKIKNYFKLFYA